MILEIILPGEVISKKNGQKIIVTGRIRKIKAGDAYLKWEKTAVQELAFNRVKWKGDYPVYLKVFFYRKTKSRFDYSNMLESVQDCLVKAEVIEDDDMNHVHPIIQGHDFDKDNPRVVVTIESKR